MSESVRQKLLEGIPSMYIREIPCRLAKVLVTAHEIAPDQHVRMQAVFQENIDSAISKTVNLPSEASVDDVDKAFRLAFTLGCKGITVYRDGARAGQALSGPRRAQAPVTGNDRDASLRDSATTKKTTDSCSACGPLSATADLNQGRPYEVFADHGEAYRCPLQKKAIYGAISAALRSDTSPNELIRQLCRISCPSQAIARGNGQGTNVRFRSAPITRAREVTLDGRARPARNPKFRVRRARSSCGRTMRREAGCLVCDQCWRNSCG